MEKKHLNIFGVGPAYALPALLWAVMKPMLACTEEKWLLALYGQEYADYCARVNRVLPWPPQKQ